MILGGAAADIVDLNLDVRELFFEVFCDRIKAYDPAPYFKLGARFDRELLVVWSTPLVLGPYKGRDRRCECNAEKVMNFHEQDRLVFGGESERM